MIAIIDANPPRHEPFGAAEAIALEAPTEEPVLAGPGDRKKMLDSIIIDWLIGFVLTERPAAEQPGRSPAQAAGVVIDEALRLRQP